MKTKREINSKTGSTQDKERDQLKDRQYSRQRERSTQKDRQYSRQRERSTQKDRQYSKTKTQKRNYPAVRTTSTQTPSIAMVYFVHQSSTEMYTP